jgi:lipid II:glycine glycyltransferase (peptidoglycan interpeptide bridge formation enzyme)
MKEGPEHFANILAKKVDELAPQNFDEQVAGIDEKIKQLSDHIERLQSDLKMTEVIFSGSGMRSNYIQKQEGKIQRYKEAIEDLIKLKNVILREKDVNAGIIFSGKAEKDLPLQ